jgi:hypothetical protein
VDRNTCLFAKFCFGGKLPLGVLDAIGKKVISTYIEQINLHLSLILFYGFQQSDFDEVSVPLYYLLLMETKGICHFLFCFNY